MGQFSNRGFACGVMETNTRPAAGGETVVEAESRFRAFSERLAVRLRWLSILSMPVIAYLSGTEVRSPAFELLVGISLVYNLIVSLNLSRMSQAIQVSVGLVLIDSLFIMALIHFSGGLDGTLAIYAILGVISACMRLPLFHATWVAGLYSIEFVGLAVFDGTTRPGQLVAMISFVFLALALVSPLVHEARLRFSQVLAGHIAQRELLHRLLRTEEEERRRIASELHDRGGGALFAMLHGLRRIRDLVKGADTAGQGEVDRLIGVTETMVRDLRVFIHDLRPNVLDDLGLDEALRELLSRERSISGIRFSLDVDAEARPDPESALALYRVAQEALTNIRRHADAHSASVRFRQEEAGFGLTIEDDGRGGSGWVPGLGVRTMHERMEALGGRLEIHPSEGTGTRISAWVPDREVGQVGLGMNGNGHSSLSR